MANMHQFMARQNAPEAKQSLTDIVVESVPLKNGTLTPRKPLSFTPFRSPSGEYLHIKNDALDISLMMHTWEELQESIGEYIAIMWEHYAEVDDEKLTPQAKDIKDNLQKCFEVQH